MTARGVRLRTPDGHRAPKRRDGFALMAALWLVVIVGVAGYELSVRSRTDRLAIANSLERVAAEGAAEAGLETARAMLDEALTRPLTARIGALSNAALDPWSVIDWQRTDTLRMGEERAVVNGYDAGARVQLNRANEGQLCRLLAALPLDASVADRMAQRIMDWRDADDSRRGRGAERADYLRTGARTLPANAEFGRIDELRDVDGMTPELYARLGQYLTVYGTGQVNVNAASATVLHSLPGLGDEAVAVLVRSQRSGRPIRSLEELTQQLSRGAASAIADAGMELTQRMTFETREMVVTADGWLDGSPVRAHGEALYARTGEALFTVWRRMSEP